ncbi:MAG: hypothetical protein Q8R28_08245 [Dehalococcoidia bacterium]|nr:hypothetical protein [Dehalococcoidia bacterium]
MIERAVGSGKTIPAIREAEKIVKRQMVEVPESRIRLAVTENGRRLGRGLLAAGFLALCTLPIITVLALVALAIFLAR